MSAIGQQFTKEQSQALRDCYRIILNAHRRMIDREDKNAKANKGAFKAVTDTVSIKVSDNE